MVSVGRPEGSGERGGRRRKRRELTEEQKQEITEAFALFDSDKDQALDYHELKVGGEKRALSAVQLQPQLIYDT